MEEMFNNLKKAGKNDVDGLIKWLKDCNIIGTSKEAEDKVRGLFGQQSKDQAKVEFAKFKEVLEKLAAEHKKNLQDMTKALTEKGPDILNQLKGEEMYQVLRGASQVDGARYDVVEKWFRRCGIIDGIYIKDDFFEHSYLRLCPNKEPLGLVQFIQLIGIFCREAKRDVEIFLRKFKNVKLEIIQEIREETVGKNYAYS